MIVQAENMLISQERRSAAAMLRSATRSAHAELDALPILDAMKIGSVSLDDYRHYLTAMVRLLEQSSKSIAPWKAELVTPLANSDCTDRLRFYRMDLSQIECELGISAAPNHQAPSQVLATDIASTCGVLYVVEGSMLGARTLVRPIRSVLGANLQAATRGLSGFQGDTGRRWRGICAALDSTLTTSSSVDRAIIAAETTFKYAASLLTTKGGE